MPVRPARPEDAREAMRVLQEVAEERVHIASEPPIDLEARADELRHLLTSGEANAWVLERDGQIDGHLVLQRLDRNPGVARLGMALVASARGAGGGRALLDAAVQWARESDLRKLDLEVWVENGRAIALYARAGFSVEGLRRDHYRRADGSLRSTLIMSLFV